MIRFAVVALLLAGAVRTNAADAPGPLTIRVAPAFSTVGFSILEFGVMKQDGSFRDFEGEVFYDAAHPERSHVRFTVKVASIDARSHAREHVLLSDDFFDAQRFPTMAFASKSVSRQPDHTLLVSGELTIRGVTKQVTVPVRYLGLNQRENESRQTFAGFETTFTLDRTEFGVNGSRWSGGKLALSKEVTVHMTIGGQVE
ncbi:MAG: YceI family protein [Acidobacteria bacterium]|nr:YceI family protein [Acidobacteriota bacterium]